MSQESVIYKPAVVISQMLIKKWNKPLDFKINPFELVYNQLNVNPEELT
jgi:hypothetical protein